MNTWKEIRIYNVTLTSETNTEKVLVSLVREEGSVTLSLLNPLLILQLYKYLFEKDSRIIPHENPSCAPEDR